jgi:hypothetical protein
MHSIHVSSGAHPDSLQWMLKVRSLCIKRQGLEVDRSAPSTAGVKNGGASPPLFHMFPWRGAYLNTGITLSRFACFQ